MKLLLLYWDQNDALQKKEKNILKETFLLVWTFIVGESQ